MNKLVIATVVSATLMTGCANMNNAQQGQLIGAALGTVARAGSRPFHCSIGASARSAKTLRD